MTQPTHFKSRILLKLNSNHNIDLQVQKSPACRSKGNLEIALSLTAVQQQHAVSSSASGGHRAAVKADVMGS